MAKTGIYIVLSCFIKNLLLLIGPDPNKGIAQSIIYNVKM